MDLKRILNLNQDEVLGLDIDSSTVRIIALHKVDAGFTVTAAGISEIETDPDSNFDETGISGFHNSAIKAIRDCYTLAKLRSQSKLRTKYAVCGVSGPEVAVRDFAFPLLPEEDIAGAVSLEAAQVCPFNADQAAVDYQLISNGNDKTKGILVAATNILMESKIQFVKEAGLHCVLMDIDGLALLNCFHGLSNGNEKSRAAILNVGDLYTTLAVMSDDGWPFIRDTACAGDDIINQIAAANNVSPSVVRPVLFGDSQDSQIEIGDNLARASEELITGVSETLRFYAAQEKSIPVRRIFVCGGFATAKGFIDLLNRRLGLEVILWNPFENIPCDASQGCKDILKDKGPALAVAAGLAMRSL